MTENDPDDKSEESERPEESSPDGDSIPQEETTDQGRGPDIDRGDDQHRRGPDIDRGDDQHRRGPNIDRGDDQHRRGPNIDRGDDQHRRGPNIDRGDDQQEASRNRTSVRDKGETRSHGPQDEDSEETKNNEQASEEVPADTSKTADQQPDTPDSGGKQQPDPTSTDSTSGNSDVTQSPDDADDGGKAPDVAEGEQSETDPEKALQQAAEEQQTEREQAIGEIEDGQPDDPYQDQDQQGENDRSDESLFESLVDEENPADDSQDEQIEEGFSATEAGTQNNSGGETREERNESAKTDTENTSALDGDSAQTPNEIDDEPLFTAEEEERDPGSTISEDTVAEENPNTQPAPADEIEENVLPPQPKMDAPRDESEMLIGDVEDDEAAENAITVKLVKLSAAAVEKWEKFTERDGQTRQERIANKYFGHFYRQREEDFEAYRRDHYRARINRDWDLELALATLRTIVAGVGAFVLSTLFFIGPGSSILLTPFLAPVLGLLIGLAVGGGVGYWLYEAKVQLKIHRRKREIEKLLPQALSYMFSHSQGQMTMPEIVENLAKEQHTFGAISEEFGIVHKEMAIFESDMREAFREARETTPSQNLSALFDELINVIDTSGELTSFLHEKTDEYQSRSQVQEERFLGRLSYVAYGYTFFGVFLPSIVIIALVLWSLSGGDVIGISVYIMWVYITLLSVAVILLVDQLSVEKLTTAPKLKTNYEGANSEQIAERIAEDEHRYPDIDEKEQRPKHYSNIQTERGIHSLVDDPRMVQSRTDGHSGPLAESERNSLVRLSRALRLVDFREAVENNQQTLKNRPQLTLLISVPFTLIYLGVVMGIGGVTPSDFGITPVVSTITLVTMPLVFTLTPLWWYARKLRLYDAQIRGELPIMLRKLSSATEAGTPLVGAIKTVGDTPEDSEAEALDQELARMRNEVSSFFVSVDGALVRMANRVQNTRLSRVNKLLLEANTSSGNLQDVLEVAASDAENSRLLDEKRKNRMEKQMAVMIVSFLAFLTIAAVLEFFLLSSLADALEFSQGVEDQTPFLPEISTTQFTLFLFHSSLAMGLFSGLAAGKFGYGDIRAGSGLALFQVLCASTIFLISALGIF